MKTGFLFLFVAFIAVSGWLAPAGYTDDGDGDLHAAARAALAAHGEAHAWLGFLVGRWELQGTFGADPAQARDLQGTITWEPVLGARFLRIETRLEQGIPGYEGLAFIGYDVQVQRYEYTSMSNQDTRQTAYLGSREGDVLTMSGVVVGAGGSYEHRFVLRKVGDDEYVADGYIVNEAGERKISELRATRLE